MHVGVAVPQSWDRPERSLQDLRRFVTTAEAGGLDGLWVQEQLLGADPSFEPLATLAYVAGITSRIRLAAAGFVAPLRPALGLAKALATLDQLSLGRLDVGLVLGEMRAAFDAVRVPWRERSARLEDTVQVLRALWSGGPVTHRSPFGDYRAARLTPAPVQPGGPPVWIGAKAGAALDRVARLADGWIGAGGASITEWQRSLEELRERCAVHGRSDLRIGKKVYLWLDEDQERAESRLAAWFAVHWSVADGGELARRVGVAGSPRRAAELLAGLVSAGADTIVLNPVGDELRQLELITGELLPELEALIPAAASVSS